MTEYIIQTTNVSKFIQNKPIVYRLNLNIPRGTLFGILGPNGAGKSTTLKLLTGRIKATSGQISVNGIDPWKHRVKCNQFIGYLPQNPVQHKEKTVLDFMVYMSRLGGFPKKESVAIARETIHRVGLGRLEENTIGKLSGGEKQRLGFANAILGDPDILILDEPTASLDPEGRVYVMDLITSLARDKSKTIIISSHILPEIQRLTDHIAIMSEGSMLISGNMRQLTRGIFDSSYEVISSHPHQLAELLHEKGYQAEVVDGSILVNTYDGLATFWEDLPKICNEKNFQLKSCKPIRDPLETLFLDLVSEKKQTEREDENGNNIETN